MTLNLLPWNQLKILFYYPMNNFTQTSAGQAAVGLNHWKPFEKRSVNVNSLPEVKQGSAVKSN